MMHNQKMRRNQLEKKRKELETAARASKKKRDKRLDEAREALKEQVRMQTRRETREKKRRQIALEVAGDLGEEEEQRLKKQFVTKQMYSTFLAGKLEKNVARSSALQQGFQKIKNATGLSDVDDILQKYLTRDETYESLVKAAKETEAQIEVAQAEQRTLQSSLESIQLQGVAGQGNRTLYREIDQFDAELSEARKQCNEYKDRSVRASMTLEDVRQCVVKLARKLDMPSDTKELPSPESLPNILKNIEEKVKGIVESLSDYVGAQDAIVAAGGGGLGSSGKEGGGNAPGAGEKDGGVAENSAGSAPAGPAATKKKESLLRQKAAAAVASETKTSNSKSGGSKTGGGRGRDSRRAQHDWCTRTRSAVQLIDGRRARHVVAKHSRFVQGVGGRARKNVCVQRGTPLGGQPGAHSKEIHGILRRWQGRDGQKECKRRRAGGRGGGRRRRD